MRTKEEILFPLHTHCDEELDMIYTHDSAKKAMDIYAEEVAHKYLEWALQILYPERKLKEDNEANTKAKSEFFQLFKQENNLT